MAYSKEGFLGSFRGRLGNLVVYEAFGKTIVRGMPSRKRGKAKGALKQSQEDFARVMQVLRSSGSFIRPGFNDVAQGRSSFHEALSVNLKRYREAEDKKGLKWFLPSQGNRAGVKNAIWIREDNKAQVSWGAPQEGKTQRPDDMVMLMAINTSSLQAVITSDTKRSQQNATIDLPPTKQGEEVEVFIAFRHHLSDKKDEVNVSQAQIAEGEDLKS